MIDLTHIGHAGWLVESENFKAIFDPWFNPQGTFMNSWHQFPDNSHLLTDDMFTNLDFLYISHAHNDHCDEWTLKKVDKSTKVISTGGSAVYSVKSMKYLKSFSKIIYINTPLKTILERIDKGQERGLAVPENLSIEEVYSERKPLYEQFSQLSIDGTKSIDELIDIVLNISNE